MITTIEPGDTLRDNNPRVSYERILVVHSLISDEQGKLAAIMARERHVNRLVRITAARIFPADKPRRTGFSHTPRKPLDPAIQALVGQPILLKRGSCDRSGPGSSRMVRARLDRVDEINVFATLLEDDPLATVAPHVTGESGVWHGLSFVAGPANDTST